MKQASRREVLAAGATACASAVLAGLPSRTVAQSRRPLLIFTGPVPVSGRSKPWGTAMDGGPREALVKHYGYTEEEYFLSGEAKVYGPGSTSPIPKGVSPIEMPSVLRPLANPVRAAVPFTTRVTMLRPLDMTRFSGNVHLIPLHNLDGTTYVEKNLLRNGDVWMGLEVNSGTRFGVEERPSGGIANLRNFDPRRYGKLSIPAGQPSDWPDLEPGRLAEAFKTINFGVRQAEDNSAHAAFLQEISRSYAQAPDIMTKMAVTLRTDAPGNPLFGHKVRRIYTAGRSGQSTILAPYIDHHHEIARSSYGQVPYDGYMIRVGSMPVHRPTGSVLVCVQSEAEIKDFSPALLATLGDSEDPMFRYYEIPGVGHGLTSRPNISGRIGGVVPEGVQGISDIEGATEFQPYDKISLPVVWGMWRNIYDWVDKGISMPRAPRVDRDPKAPDGLARDKFGNATGGIRLPWMDYPDARYVGVISEKNPLEGGMMPFSSTRMNELYGSRDVWLKKLDLRLDQMVRERWIEAGDVALMRARGVTAALALGFDDYAGDSSAGGSPTL